MNSADQEPQRLLAEEGRWTEPWGGSEHGTRCGKCGGSGTVAHQCWSCLLTGAAGSCPVCAGKVRWEDRCPVCRGSGETDGEPRYGVSVFPTVEGLYYYMNETEAELEGCLVVELDAEAADDVDFDADQGAMLVIPTRILGCEPVDPDLIERVQALAEHHRSYP
jgi:hypothetical protein